MNKDYGMHSKAYCCCFMRPAPLTRAAECITWQVVDAPNLPEAEASCESFMAFHSREQSALTACAALTLLLCLLQMQSVWTALTTTRTDSANTCNYVVQPAAGAQSWPSVPTCHVPGESFIDLLT